MKRFLSAPLHAALLAWCWSGSAAADDPPATPLETPAPDAAPDAAPATAAEAPVGEQSAGPVGTVKGQLIDGSTKEPLPAATIQVVGGPSAIAELDGTYALRLPPGSYAIVFSTPEYVEQRRTITVAADQAVVIDAELAPAPRTGKAETIEVAGAIDTRKEI